MNKCLDCGKQITKGAKRCRVCSNTGKLNPMYKLNKPISYCKTCGKQLSKSKYIYCQEHFQTLEYRKKQGVATIKLHTGLKRSKETKRKLREAWIHREPVTQETKDKRKETMRNKTGVELKEMYNKISIANSGDKNGRWQGGASFEPYGLEFNNELKAKIRRIHAYICTLCSKAGRSVHHIDYDKENNWWFNFTNLCNSCHSKTNSNREFWQELLETRQSIYSSVAF